MADHKWDLRFLDIAFTVASWSKDPSNQTGCVVVRDRRIVSTGFNGFPSGVKDIPSRYDYREVKYKFVAHDGLNAVCSAAKDGVSLDGCTIYLTAVPCHECTKSIIQSGIGRVVCPKGSFMDTLERWAESTAVSELMMKEAGVEFERIDYSAND